MTEKEKLDKYSAFRDFCLTNAKTAFASAKLLKDNNANHIAFHLLVLTLEEMGKMLVGYHAIMKAENSNGDQTNLGFDDHVKKLFWVIWGPTFGSEIVSQMQLQQNKKLASTLHQKRLDTLYTGLYDEHPGSEKISTEELDWLYSFTEGRLNYAISEAQHPLVEKPSAAWEWFHEQTEDPEKISFILGEESQAKFLELGTFQLWTDWLREYFEVREKELAELIDRELTRATDPEQETTIPKWKMKIKLNSPSHSIRQNVLDAFNNPKDIFKLLKGGDNHTLYIEITIGDYVSVKDLWQTGWYLSKCYVAALNVASNGYFYWNANLDTEKYYESLHDLENNKALKLTYHSGLQINWSERKAVLNEHHLNLSRTVFRYFLKLRDKKLIGAFNLFLAGTALLAKNDIHSRFDQLMFTEFFEALQFSLEASLNLESNEDHSEIGYQQMEKIIKTKSEFIRIYKIGLALHKGDRSGETKIKLPEVLLAKQYCSFYFLTLAVRDLHGNNDLFIFAEEGDL